jgi:hypothetical protein
VKYYLSCHDAKLSQKLTNSKLIKLKEMKFLGGNIPSLASVLSDIGEKSNQKSITFTSLF